MFQPMFISSTPSSALRPRHGAMAEWADSPLKRVLDRDHARCRWLAPGGLEVVADMGEEHGVDAVEHAVADQVGLAAEQLLGHARPQHHRAGDLLPLHDLLQRERRDDIHGLAGVVALAMSRRAFDHRLVVCDARLLRRLRNAVDVAAERDHGPARAPVGDPGGRQARDIPLNVKPFFSRMSVMYFEVSTSWNPSSPKLKIESFISWASLARASTPATARFFSSAIRSTRAAL